MAEVRPNFWWERLFEDLGACACIHDFKEDEASAKVEIVEDGEVIASVEHGKEIEYAEEAVNEEPIDVPEHVIPHEDELPSEAPEEAREASEEAREASEEAREASEEAREASEEEESKKENLQVDLTETKEVLKSAGIPFKKHCRDGKIRDRTLVISEDEKRFGWKLGQKKMIPLAEVKSVRAAYVVDPATIGNPKHPNGMAGTVVLRKTGEGPLVARRAFSFILEDRTVDVECFSETQARKLCAAFKLLVDKAKTTTTK
ncbi:hypothetical protein CTAYLR_007139 [Chrysophaeum taylorii]|uniref:Uncharacterized protein n=1 Tax=Chrysophaeum taylorii TaxID=2483200 RepID=A0AAD7UMA0_9STRA|nr:hypothetical protein CTAYLR_007139 [Chrysophaeum taylorii]